ncbi:KTSC domain-containing protein [Porticoccaceae bacterium]|nr:KTSC domain-containing protein [Porticoccaceae bacterium]
MSQFLESSITTDHISAIKNVRDAAHELGLILKNFHAFDGLESVNFVTQSNYHYANDSEGEIAFDKDISGLESSISILDSLVASVAPSKDVQALVELNAEKLRSIHHLLDQKFTDEFERALIVAPEKSGHVDIGSLAHFIFGGATKKTKRLICGALEGSRIPYEGLAIARTLIKSGINRDLVINGYEGFVGRGLFPLVPVSAFTVVGVESIRALYTDKRVVAVVFSDLGLFADTTRMLRRISDSGTKFSEPIKPKNLGEVHNCAASMMSKIGQEDFTLNQREDILALDGKALGDTGFTLGIPKTHFHLIDVGESLAFCIGNGAYSQSVANGSTSIATIWRGGELKYAIEFTRFSIEQAQGFGNRTENKPPREVLAAIEELLIEAPTLPDDFLPITDSRWVNGYKYTQDGDLYLLLSEIVYVYSGVPVEVYEGLLSSHAKGSYVNREIKNKFHYSKVGPLLEQ